MIVRIIVIIVIIIAIVVVIVVHSSNTTNTGTHEKNFKVTLKPRVPMMLKLVTNEDATGHLRSQLHSLLAEVSVGLGLRV